MAEPTPSASPPPARKPWSMTWIAAVIVAYIVFHTVINLGFRKEERPHEPAAAARERKRLFVTATMGGWTRFATQLATPASSSSFSSDIRATVVRESAPGDLAKIVPLDLAGIFPGKPSMYPAPEAVEAPATLAADAELRVRLSFATMASPVDFGEAMAYAKDQHLRLFVQDEERAPLDTPPLPAAPLVELSLPPGALTAGAWQVTLYAKDVCFTWQFTVTAAETGSTPPSPGTAGGR